MQKRENYFKKLRIFQSCGHDERIIMMKRKHRVEECLTKTQVEILSLCLRVCVCRQLLCVPAQGLLSPSS